MAKTAKSSKLLLGFVIVLAVMLVAAFSMSSTADADGISDDYWGTVDDDFMSSEGHNFKGGPHFYLLIENYMFLPDDATITFDCPVWGYHQTLTKQNLVGRLGYVRLPADVRVTISSATYTGNYWHTADLTVEGSQLFYTGTLIPGVDNTVYADSCDIFMFGPVGGHIVGLWAGLGDRVGGGSGDPTDPTDPSDPSGPSDPDDPKDPTDPSDPSGPSDPDDPKDPTDPGDPSGPSDPDDPKDPTDPTDPKDPNGDDDGNDPKDPNGDNDGDNSKDPPKTGFERPYVILGAVALVSFIIFAATSYRKRKN